jgi:hypothetical protein
MEIVGVGGAASSFWMLPSAVAVLMVPELGLLRGDGESFGLLERGVSRHVHGDHLGRLTVGKIHRATGEGAAIEIRRIGRTGTATRDGIARAERASQRIAAG